MELNGLTFQNWRTDYESIYYWNSNRAIFSIFGDKRFMVIKIVTIMTDEQIKQNAEEYYDKLGSITIEVENEPNSIVDAYIAGAHSRDEEINKLKKLYEEALHKYYEAECKLRNQWISVEQQLPEIEDEKEERTGEVFVCIKDDVYLVAHYSYFYKAWYAFSDKGGCMYRKIRTPRYWMPIPELKKENKQ